MVTLACIDSDIASRLVYTGDHSEVKIRLSSALSSDEKIAIAAQ
jgi:hypothetical protein